MSDRVPPADGQCQIRYRLDGVIREWGVGCDAHNDTDESMAAHLARWRPQAEFLGCCITRVKDDTVMSDSRRELTDTEQQVEKIERTQRAMNAGFTEAVVVLKGSVEFRNAVEALLVGTPHVKPTADAYDFEGLYGRLRNALQGRRSCRCGTTLVCPDIGCDDNKVTP
jgi:hypothetical protein